MNIYSRLVNEKKYIENLTQLDRIRNDNIDYAIENFNEITFNFINQWILVQDTEPRIFMGSNDLNITVHNLRSQMILRPGSILIYSTPFGSFNRDTSFSYLVLDIDPKTLEGFLP